LALLVGTVTSVFGTADAAAQPTGIDVSSLQGVVDWEAVVSWGVSFAYVKATEGTSYQNPSFAQQYDGAMDAGLIRGAYHLALPDQSPGAQQADYFVDHGGDWAADDHTLPGVVDLEADGLGDACYGLAPADLVAWLHDFADEYKVRTNRDVIVYTTADWWNSCTAGSSEFSLTNPLWVAHYGTTPLALPADWSFYTFWQFTGSGTVPGVAGTVAQSVFNGDRARLLALANNTPQ